MITQESIYAALGIDVGDHFRYRGLECRVDERPALLIYDYEWGDWIKSRYQTLQVEWLAEHIDEAETLPIEEWHIDHYEDCPKHTEFLREHLRNFRRKHEKL